MFGPDDDRVEQALEVERFNRDSAYNRPGFKPVRRELTQAPVTVTGTLPADLEGVYIRNGTNPQFDRSRVRYHMFSGAGMLHQVQIANGAATYSNTYIRTPRF
jgi:carotenoid cleavage dioxygenase